MLPGSDLCSSTSSSSEASKQEILTIYQIHQYRFSPFNVWRYISIYTFTCCQDWFYVLWEIFLSKENLLSFNWLLLVVNSLVSSLQTIDHFIKAILDGSICIYIQPSKVLAKTYQYSLKMMNIELKLWTYRKILTWLCLQTGQCLSVHCWNGWRWTSESLESMSSLPTCNINEKRNIVLQVLPSTIKMDLIHFAHAICIYWQYYCTGKMQLYCTGNSTWILAISSYELGSIKAWK